MSGANGRRLRPMERLSARCVREKQVALAKSSDGTIVVVRFDEQNFSMSPVAAHDLAADIDFVLDRLLLSRQGL